MIFLPYELKRQHWHKGNAKHLNIKDCRSIKNMGESTAASFWKHKDISVSRWSHSGTMSPMVSRTCFIAVANSKTTLKRPGSICLVRLTEAYISTPPSTKNYNPAIPTRQLIILVHDVNFSELYKEDLRHGILFGLNRRHYSPFRKTIDLQYHLML